MPKSLGDWQSAGNIRVGRTPPHNSFVAGRLPRKTTGVNWLSLLTTITSVEEPIGECKKHRLHLRKDVDYGENIFR